MKIKKTLWNILVIFGLLINLSLFGCSNSKNESVEEEKRWTTSELEEYFKGNVFQIIVYDLGKIPVATGTGFVLDSSGWFATNAHVMEDAYYAEAIFNIPDNSKGESFTKLNISSGSYMHEDKDIFIGKISYYNQLSKYYKKLYFNSNYEIGETVYTVGYPNSSINLEVNKGKIISEISSLYDKLYSGNSYIGYDSYSAHGSSGGILINNKREVLGITTLGYTNSIGVYQYGAAISYFNFKNQISSLNSYSTNNLMEFIHPEDKTFIKAWNDLKTRFENGDSAVTRVVGDDFVRYILTTEKSGENSDGEKYAYFRQIMFDSNMYIGYEEVMTWANGDERLNIFMGEYNSLIEFDEFVYTFGYEWKNGKYYVIKCYDINYNSNIELTLRNYKVIDKSSGYTVSSSNIEYAKDQFNWVYEYMVDFMDDYK